MTDPAYQKMLDRIETSASEHRKSKGLSERDIKEIARTVVPLMKEYAEQEVAKAVAPLLAHIRELELKCQTMTSKT